MIIKNHLQNKNGYAALLMTIIVSTVAISVVSLLATQLSRSSKLQHYSRVHEQSVVIADSCIEEILFGIKNTTIGAGASSMALHGGVCDYTVVHGGGEIYSVEIVAELHDYTYKTQVSVDEINPDIHITTWETVIDH